MLSLGSSVKESPEDKQVPPRVSGEVPSAKIFTLHKHYGLAN